MRIVVTALCVASLVMGTPSTVLHAALLDDPITEEEETGGDEVELCPVAGSNRSADNGDCSVSNTSSSPTRKATVCPANATDATCSTVTLPTSFKGSVGGIEGDVGGGNCGGDVVDTDSNADFTASGTGGTINLGAGSKVVVTNTAAAGGGTIFVKYDDANGDEQTFPVGPGQTKTVPPPA